MFINLKKIYWLEENFKQLDAHFTSVTENNSQNKKHIKIIYKLDFKLGQFYGVKDQARPYIICLKCECNVYHSKKGNVCNCRPKQWQGALAAENG